MVLKHDLCDLIGEFDSLEDIIADLRVRFDQVKVNLCELPGPAEDLGRNPDFAHIMDHSSHSDTFDFLFR